MDNLGFGLGLALTGMAIVFGLLAALWIVLSLGLRLDRRTASAPVDSNLDRAGPPAPAVKTVPALGREAAAPDPRLLAAIAIAVLRHTDERRRQAAPAMRSYWPGSLLFASRWVGTGRMRQGQSWRQRSR